MSMSQMGNQRLREGQGLACQVSQTRSGAAGSGPGSA